MPKKLPLFSAELCISASAAFIIGGRVADHSRDSGRESPPLLTQLAPMRRSHSGSVPGKPSYRQSANSIGRLFGIVCHFSCPEFCGTGAARQKYGRRVDRPARAILPKRPQFFVMPPPSSQGLRETERPAYVQSNIFSSERQSKPLDNALGHPPAGAFTRCVF